jgi:hypothetical protein
MQDLITEHDIPPFPMYDDATREAHSARKTLEGHEGDLWIFGYGSLIWDPALEFAEVRRAFAPRTTGGDSSLRTSMADVARPRPPA